MKKNSNIVLVVTSLAVVGVLGYLLMRQMKATQKAKSDRKPMTNSMSESKNKTWADVFSGLLEWSKTEEYKQSQNKTS